MARPKQDNAEYFSHDKNMRNDPKVKALRRKFKGGYGIYNMLLEVLTEANFFMLELSIIQVELLAGDFDIEADELEQIIDYCVKIQLLEKEGNTIYSCGLKKRLQPVLDHRNRAKEKYLKQKEGNDSVSASETTQSKVKYSKVKESKKIVVEEEITEPEIFEEKNEKTVIPEIPVDVFIDEEQKSVLVERLKNHAVFRNIQKNQEMKPQEVLKLFDVFFEQKTVLNELKGKSEDDMIKNFYWWVPKHQQANKPQKTTSNVNPNNQTGRTTASGSADLKRAERGNLKEQSFDKLRGLLQGTEPKQ